MFDKTCKHFNGSINTHCKAGVCYRDVTVDPDEAGSWLRIPCHTEQPFKNPNTYQIDDFNRRGKCDKLELPTADEIAEDEAWVQAATDRMLKTLPLVGRVKQEHSGQDWKGVEVCPICDGKLHLSHSSLNGHVWGKCETDDCVSWIE